MTLINHYEANTEIRYLYHELEERFRELEAFLVHLHGFVTNAEQKLGPDLKLYSEDFFDYFYAGTYGVTFRDSFIVTVSSICEGHIKDFVSTITRLLKTDMPNSKWNNSILDILKEADKTYFKLGLDFNRKEIIDFKGLLAVRNAIVHSNGTTEYVEKYVPLIKQLSKTFPSVELTEDGILIASERFCHDSITIGKSFFFYISKLALRKFPNYQEHRPSEEDF